MSEKLQIEGTVKVVEETKEYGSNGFTKRIMVIEMQDGQYSQMIPVEAVKDKCEMFDGIQAGDIVTAYVNLRGSEWNDRYFLSLNCWKVDVDAQAQPATSEADRPHTGVTDLDGLPVHNKSEVDDNLPF